MRQTVTLEVTRKATVVVDVARSRVESVKWDPEIETRAVHIPGSAGEAKARDILMRERYWLR